MIAVDTNVLARAFAGDDPHQSAVARGFLRTLTVESPGFVSLTAVFELSWVLRRSLRSEQHDVVRSSTISFDRDAAKRFGWCLLA